MRFALILAVLAATFVAPAWAQLAPTPTDASPPRSASATAGPEAAVAPHSPAPSHAVLPSSILVELKGLPPASSKGIDGAVAVAFLTGLMGLVIAAYNSWRMGSTERMKADAARDTEQMKLLATKDMQLVKQYFDAAQAERQHFAEQQREEANRLLATGQHQDKIALEMQALQLRGLCDPARRHLHRGGRR